MNIAIIKYNAGNVASVMYALDRIGAKYTWTDDEKVIQAADKVIFPGVGEASTAMAYLKEKKLDQLIPTLKQPVLATCIGMQLLCKHSEENDTDCLGIFDIEVFIIPSITNPVNNLISKGLMNTLPISLASPNAIDLNCLFEFSGTLTSVNPILENTSFINSTEPMKTFDLIRLSNLPD